MKIIGMFLILCLSSCATLFPPYLKKIDSGILEKKIEKIRKKHNQPAMAAAVIQGDTIVAQGAAGTIMYKTGERVNVDTSRFHIGSTTKGVTAVLIALLVEEGRVAWDTRLKEVFPEIVMGKVYEDVTLHQLLTSTGGIVPMQDNESEPWAPDLWNDIPFRFSDPVTQRYELTKAALNLEPIAEPGKTFCYSNAGWAILGAVAEKVCNESFEDLMHKRIFTVLGMSSARIGGWPASEEDPRQPRGHYGRVLNPYTREYAYKEYVEPGPQSLDDDYVFPAWMNPAGGIHCTIKDFALFARDQLLGLQGKGMLLTKESYEKIHSVNKVTTMDGRIVEIGYGFGISPVNRGKDNISGGDGSGGTFYAKIIIYPAINVGFVSFTNCGNGDPGITELMMSLIGGFL